MAVSTMKKMNERLDRLTTALELAILVMVRDDRSERSRELYRKIDELLLSPTPEILEFQTRESHTRQWLADQTGKASGISTFRACYADYQAWAAGKGHPAMGTKHFGMILNDLGHSTWKDGFTTFKMKLKLNSGEGYSAKQVTARKKSG